MKAKACDGYVAVEGIGFFSARHTFECGQCFRWNARPDGAYEGVAYGRHAVVWMQENKLCISGSMADFETIWRAYFDLDRDYAAITEKLPQDAFMQRAVAFGQGLRILAQPPWEALCSFIISQCNNIPRIRGIIGRLCRAYGVEIGNGQYAFPDPEVIAALQERDLSCIQAGYRTPYILNAARRIASGSLDLKALAALPTEALRRALLQLQGVGAKVADCTILFGFGRLDAFPVDTWMKKASAFYPQGFNADSFGPYAGIAQQYIFYYARSFGLKEKVRE